MKKLIAVLAAVAGALGLHAANNIGTSFEGLLPEGVASTNYVDVFSEGGAEIETGKTPGDYWDVSAAVFDEEGFVVKNYGEETKPTDDQRSDYYSTHANTNYLAITTKVGHPVTRYIKAEDAGSHAAVTVQDDGSYYFDASVKFTAFETNKEASVILADGGKLAIWLRANVDPDTLEPTSTDLIVSAGRLSNNEGWVTTPTNYVCELRNPEGVDVTDGGWHRVSVKMFGSIYDNTPVPGFSIAIDSKLVRFKGEEGDSGIVDNPHLTARVKGLYNTRTLFPSAVLTGDTTAISSVSFDGVGALDDLVFTDTNPSIDGWNDSGSVTIDAGDNVTGYTYTIQGESPVVASGTVNLQYSAVEGKTITISGVVCENGYVPSGVSTNGTDILEGWEISDIFDMETITVLAKDAGATVSGAATGNGSYETAAAVFAAIGNGDITPSGSDPITVTLSQNANEGITLSADVSVVLDLAGQTITGDSGDGAIVIEAGTLTITNTVNAGGIVNAGSAANAVYVDSGIVLITAGIYNGTVGLDDGDGQPLPGCEIKGGKFEIASNSDESVYSALQIAVADGLGSDYSLAAEDGYYVVTHVVASYSVTYNLDLAGATNAVGNIDSYTIETPTFTLLDAGCVGYTFTGWTNEWGAAITTIAGGSTGDITLYASWEAIEYDVTYNLDLVGATNAVDNITSYTVETAAFTLLPAGCENYNFLGWTNSVGETVSEIAGGATGDVTLYAKWEAAGGGLDPEHGTTDAHSSAATPAAAETEVKSNIIVPAGAAAAVSKDDYADYFKYGVSGTAGDYTVSITGIVESVEADVAASAVVRLTDGEATDIDIPAGLYFRITPSTDLPISGTPTNGLSTGSVIIDKPGTDKGFYKVELNATPLN